MESISVLPEEQKEWQAKKADDCYIFCGPHHFQNSIASPYHWDYFLIGKHWSQGLILKDLLYF